MSSLCTLLNRVHACADLVSPELDTTTVLLRRASVAVAFRSPKGIFTASGKWLQAKYIFAMMLANNECSLAALCLVAMCSSVATMCSGHACTIANMVDNIVKPLHYSRHKCELISETVPDVKYLLLSDIKQDDAIIVINGFHALKVLCSD